MSIPNNANTYLPPVVQIPSALSITAITKAFPMVVTVSANSDQSNSYIAGMAVKLNVPANYGMIQANGLVATITEVDDDEITLNVDSRKFDTFSIPSTFIYGATLCPFGSRNLQYNNNTNIVPFQSLNNIGN